MIRVTRSLFRNIVLWYTLCVTIVGIVYTTVLYREIERGKWEPFKVRLVAQSKFLADRLRYSGDDIDLTFIFPEEFSNSFFAVYEPDWRSSVLKSMPWYQLRWSTNSIEYAKLYERNGVNKSYYGSCKGQHNQEYRFAVTRVAVQPLSPYLQRANPGQTKTVYIVYADLYEQYDQYLNVRKHILAGTAVLVGLLVLVSGIIVARFGVRPIRRMAAAAMLITPEDTKTRLPVAALPDELGYLAERLNMAFDRLEAALASERKFTGAAAHELRSPVAGIASRLDTLRRTEGLTAEAQEQIELLYADAQRLARLSGRLLLLARLDRAAAGEDFPSAIVDLAEIAEDAIEFCRMNAEDRGISFFLEKFGDTTLDGHEEWLLRAVHNVLNNAIKYSPDHGHIYVKVNAPVPGSFVKVEISDEGPGIPASERGHVCERFYRSSATIGTAEGAGLGLAIVADVMRAHRGELEILAGPGNVGTMVRLRMPRERKTVKEKQLQ